MKMKMKMKKIYSPSYGKIVRHTGWRYEKDPNYPCDVFIIDGQYMSNDRLSNFWIWRRVLPDGTLGEEERNYGDFVESENQYEVEIKLKLINKMTESKFLQKVAKYGEVQACKKGVVFSFMITNSKGYNEEDNLALLSLIREYSSEYPTIEVILQDVYYFLIVKKK